MIGGEPVKTERECMRPLVVKLEETKRKFMFLFVTAMLAMFVIKTE